MEDRSKVETLVRWSDPWVRALDGIAGERMSMRVSCYKPPSVVLEFSDCS